MFEITIRIYSSINDECMFLSRCNGLYASFIKKMIELEDPYATIKKIIVVNYDNENKFNEGTSTYAFVTLQYHDKIGINSFANLGYFKSRLAYLSLIESCSLENNHITKYLFNDYVAREICTYISHTKVEDDMGINDSRTLEYEDNKKKILWNIKKHYLIDETLLLNSVNSMTTYYIPKGIEYMEYMNKIFSEESQLDDEDNEDDIPPPIPMLYRDAYVEFIEL
jgi:hypothetical protein